MLDATCKLDINDKVRLPDGREFQVCASTWKRAGYSVTQLPHQGLVYRLKGHNFHKWRYSNELQTNDSNRR